ncbi:phenylalanine--tRNA ligase subunit beta [Candidatus Peregrinibacteria bacterium]|nr:phenylalanine--tRNA ligase subunit beta [Candidatus Peregrinibacteria bacterium]
MKISLKWLSDFVEFTEKDPMRIADALTEKSAEVDKVVNSLSVFDTVLTGKLLEFQKIEGSDKLHLGVFDVGESSPRKIIFGSVFELKVGEVYPIALPGTELPSGVHVKSAKIRGVESNGMVCSEEELSTSYTKEGLFRFSEKTPLGRPILHLLREYLKNVVVGKIEKIEKHPNADKLSVVSVSVETRFIASHENVETRYSASVQQIVCGGSNLHVGAKVPIALPGANLWNEIPIKISTIRDVESNGMICSTEELHVAPSQNKEIYLLPDDAPVGTAFFDYVFPSEIVFDFENTALTNRPDLFSHTGFARECVASGVAKMKNETYPSPKMESKNPLPISITIRNQEEICPRYMAVYITGIDGKTASPEWMQKRLELCGIRPLNAIIDATNYVMLERGTPMHAFDMDLVGKEWVMRVTRPGEKMVTLDGIERKMSADTIIIEDEKNGIFDLCGIMGGKNSGIQESTESILLHTSVYDAVKIRRSALALTHRTEAATIFEKGVPPHLVEEGILRVIELLLEIFPNAKVASKILDKKAFDEKPRTIELDPKLVDRMAGIEIPKDRMKEILEDLGFFLVETKGGIFDVVVPAWRTGDIRIPEDLVEEIIRIYGLDAIPEKAPDVRLLPIVSAPHRVLEKKLANIFVKNGFYEIVTLAFLGEDLLKRCQLSLSEANIKLANPLSADLSIMRPSLSPRLFEVAERNRRHREKFRIFESGNVFRMEGDRKIEELRMTGLFVGDDFLTAKGIAEEILASEGWKYHFEASDLGIPFAHPAKSALYRIGKKGYIKIFEIHPKVAKEFDLPIPSTILCLNTKELAEIPQKAKKILPLPKYQEIPFDFSVLCDQKMPVADIIQGLEKLDTRIYKSSIMEAWEGKGVPKGKKSVTLSFEFRSEERTLTDEERDEIFKILLAELEKRGAKYRF